MGSQCVFRHDFHALAVYNSASAFTSRMHIASKSEKNKLSWAYTYPYISTWPFRSGPPKMLELFIVCYGHFILQIIIFISSSITLFIPCFYFSCYHFFKEQQCYPIDTSFCLLLCLLLTHI